MIADAPTPLLDGQQRLSLRTNIETLAEILGESPNKILTQDAQWARFMREGAHVTVTVRRWRATTSATLADLGLEPDLTRWSVETDESYATRVKQARAATMRVLQLGKWRLLPPEIISRFDALEMKLRRNLENTGFRTHWGRWIHTERYAEWKAAHETLTAEYDALVDDIVENWESIQERVARDLGAEGERAYGRAKRSAAYTSGQLQLPETVYDFVAAFLARIQKQVIRRDEIRDRFGVDYTVAMIPLAAQVAEDNVQAQRIQLDAVTAQMAEDIKRDAAREAAKGVGRFVADIQGQIRAEIYDTVVDYLDVLKDGSKRAPNTKLLNLCEKVSKDVFWSDPDLEARIAELKTVASADPKARDTAALTGVLKTLGAEARIALIELDRLGDREVRPDLDLSDDLPSLEAVATRSGSDVDFDLESPEIDVIGRREAVLDL